MEGKIQVSHLKRSTGRRGNRKRRKEGEGKGRRRRKGREREGTKGRNL